MVLCVLLYGSIITMNTAIDVQKQIAQFTSDVYDSLLVINGYDEYAYMDEYHGLTGNALAASIGVHCTQEEVTELENLLGVGEGHVESTLQSDEVRAVSASKLYDCSLLSVIASIIVLVLHIIITIKVLRMRLNTKEMYI